MKNMVFIAVLLLLSIGMAGAVTQNELNEAKTLIDSNISCNKLNSEQLELIGEYYMEQMMPGQAHVRAHEMMGLTEGSAAEEQFHINLARRSYCGENVGVMGGMMGGGMMRYYPTNNYYGYENFIWIILLLGLTALVSWLIYKSLKKAKSDYDDPLSILKSRYAKGEISKKGYEEMKKSIER
jgi:uncharacterized membrane protein